MPPHSLAAAPSPQSSLAPLWTEVLPHLDPMYGGIATSVPRAAQAAAATGHHRASLVAFCRPDEQIPAGTDADIFPMGRRQWLTVPGLRPRLERALSPAAGLHIHGLWQEHAALSAAHARRRHTPYVMSAHGMLDAWALRHRGFKKRLYAALIERRNLENATCLRALTHTELADYRGLGLRNPVVIIPNGVDIPDTGTNEFFARFPEFVGKRLILYMGRIHHKKGPALLCQAWARIHASFPDAHLVLAGPDFEGTSAEIATLIAERGLGASVSMPGLLIAPYTWGALRAATVFVLPSYSEGLSRAVLEAMGCGVPVLITHACNFPEVARHECGVIVDADEIPLANALSDLLKATPAELHRLGDNGARLTRERFSWDVVGRQLSELYSWALGDGQPPADLHEHQGWQGRR